MLPEILEQIPGSEIFCLVRGSTESEAEERLRKSVNFYEIEVSAEHWRRVHVVCKKHSGRFSVNFFYNTKMGFFSGFFSFLVTSGGPGKFRRSIFGNTRKPILEFFGDD
jgi:hypothetical protein